MAWEEREGKLVRTVTKKDFAEAMEYVNTVAQLAEAANHHPDIHISWNTVTLELFTHSENAITDADRQLAAGIDGLDG